MIQREKAQLLVPGDRERGRIGDADDVPGQPVPVSVPSDQPPDLGLVHNRCQRLPHYLRRVVAVVDDGDQLPSGKVDHIAVGIEDLHVC